MKNLFQKTATAKAKYLFTLRPLPGGGFTDGFKGTPQNTGNDGESILDSLNNTDRVNKELEANRRVERLKNETERTNLNKEINPKNLTPSQLKVYNKLVDDLKVAKAKNQTGRVRGLTKAISEITGGHAVPSQAGKEFTQAEKNKFTQQLKDWKNLKTLYRRTDKSAFQKANAVYMKKYGTNLPPKRADGGSIYRSVRNIESGEKDLNKYILSQIPPLAKGTSLVKLNGLTYRGRRLLLDKKVAGAKSAELFTILGGDEEETQHQEDYVKVVQHIANSVGKGKIKKFFRMAENGDVVLANLVATNNSLKHFEKNQWKMGGVDKADNLLAVRAIRANGGVKSAHSKKGQERLEMRLNTDRDFNGIVDGPFEMVRKNPTDIKAVNKVLAMLGIPSQEVRRKMSATEVQQRGYVDGFDYLNEQKVMSDLISARVITKDFNFQKVRAILINAGQKSLGKSVGNTTFWKRLTRGKTSQEEKNNLYFARGAYNLYSTAKIHNFDLASAFQKVSGMRLPNTRRVKAPLRSLSQRDKNQLKALQKAYNANKSARGKATIAKQMNDIQSKYGQVAPQSSQSFSPREQKAFANKRGGYQNMMNDAYIPGGTLDRYVRQNRGVSIGLVVSGLHTKDVVVPKDTEEVVKQWVERDISTDVSVTKGPVTGGETEVIYGNWKPDPSKPSTSETVYLPPEVREASRNTTKENVKFSTHVDTLIEKLKDPGYDITKITTTTITTETGQLVTRVICETVQGSYEIIIDNETRDVTTVTKPKVQDVKTTTMTTTKEKDKKLIKITKYKKQKPPKEVYLTVQTHGTPYVVNWAGGRASVNLGTNTKIDFANQGIKTALTANAYAEHHINDRLSVYGGGSVSQDVLGKDQSDGMFGSLFSGVRENWSKGLSTYQEVHASNSNIMDGLSDSVYKAKAGIDFRGLGLSHTTGLGDSKGAYELTELAYDKNRSRWTQEFEKIKKEITDGEALAHAQKVYAPFGVNVRNQPAAEQKKFIDLARVEIAEKRFINGVGKSLPKRIWDSIQGGGVGVGTSGTTPFWTAFVSFVSNKRLRTHNYPIPHSINKTRVEQRQLQNGEAPRRKIEAIKDLKCSGSVCQIVPRDFIMEHLPDSPAEAGKEVYIEVYGSKKAGMHVNKSNGTFSFGNQRRRVPEYYIRTIPTGVVIEVGFGKEGMESARHGTDHYLVGKARQDGTFSLRDELNLEQKVEGVRAPTRESAYETKNVQTLTRAGGYYNETQNLLKNNAEGIARNVKNRILAELRLGHLHVEALKKIERSFQGGGQIGQAQFHIEPIEEKAIRSIIKDIPKNLETKYIANQIFLARMQWTNTTGNHELGSYKKNITIKSRIEQANRSPLFVQDVPIFFMKRSGISLTHSKAMKIYKDSPKISEVPIKGGEALMNGQKGESVYFKAAAGITLKSAVQFTRVVKGVEYLVTIGSAEECRNLTYVVEPIRKTVRKYRQPKYENTKRRVRRSDVAGYARATQQGKYERNMLEVDITKLSITAFFPSTKITKAVSYIEKTGPERTKTKTDVKNDEVVIEKGKKVVKKEDRQVKRKTEVKEKVIDTKVKKTSEDYTKITKGKPKIKIIKKKRPGPEKPKPELNPTDPYKNPSIQPSRDKPTITNPQTTGRATPEQLGVDADRVDEFYDQFKF